MPEDDKSPAVKVVKDSPNGENEISALRIRLDSLEKRLAEREIEIESFKKKARPFLDFL